MLNRKIDNDIDVHFSNSKKALFLTGARQVGKTYSIRKYAKRHGLNLIEFNFLLQPEAMDIINGAEMSKNCCSGFRHIRESLWCEAKH